MAVPAPRETLLSMSAVYMFGRLVSDLQLVKPDDEDAERSPRNGANAFLQRQLRDDHANIARVFYFSFEGALFELARPALFLVHGPGLPVDTAPAENADIDLLAKTPPRMTRTGLGWQFGSFASDMKVWVYDKGDFSMRLDVDTGPLEQILLAAESGSGAMGFSNGVMARSSGALARSSGAMARSSGAMPRRPGDID
jgi:hypothetical protein